MSQPRARGGRSPDRLDSRADHLVARHRSNSPWDGSSARTLRTSLKSAPRDHLHQRALARSRAAARCRAGRSPGTAPSGPSAGRTRRPCAGPSGRGRCTGAPVVRKPVARSAAVDAAGRGRRSWCRSRPGPGSAAGRRPRAAPWQRTRCGASGRSSRRARKSRSAFFSSHFTVEPMPLHGVPHLLDRDRRELRGGRREARASPARGRRSSSGAEAPCRRAPSRARPGSRP